jgi:hypothetical protein
LAKNTLSVNSMTVVAAMDSTRGRLTAVIFRYGLLDVVKIGQC